ncbi:MAG: helix-turn-helix transcriptional regulator [Oscillospiraceae bacterium]|jgi:AraC-like DNA-binding protein|nr:helix-turn-helix transcriptional regulator [Oscillospiraceae bacterium]MCI9588365.1 helix-turn-helix transcriptional regulator [Oscillospiraceae bacterium]
MPTLPSVIQEIKPAPPPAVIEELLSVPLAVKAPMEAGNIYSGSGHESEIQLIAALGGSLTVSSHQQYALLDTGQALALCCPGPYTVQSVSPCTCMAIHLRGELPGRLLGHWMSEGAALLARGAAAVREAVSALFVLHEEHPPVDGAVASSHAYTLLTKLSGEDQSSSAALSPLIESAISIIQEEFPYLEGLDELSQRLEISKAHLIRSFMKKTGVSPGKYLTRVRIEYAKLLLQDEDASVTYAAEASGFANANYFAKVFRKETGMSPSEYLETIPRRKAPLRGPERGPLL